ncbi:CBO0543 family protein [Bacillus songklensis]|uniref:CBO0543 family protein n=1 Tax=Bacillus songklensis TaxID=1069116 RepID=A0ABV8B0G4_9BACI
MKQKENVKIIQGFYDHIVEVHKEYYAFWKEHILFHWDWWLSVALAVIPWLIWVKVHRKESRGRLLYVIFFLIIVTAGLDFLGVILGLWYYPGKIVPIIPSYIPWDFSLIPVIITLLIQFKPHIAPWKKALFFSGLTAFVGEPIFMKLGLYTRIHWEYFYSFPIYIALYLIADKLSKTDSFAPLS